MSAELWFAIALEVSCYATVTYPLHLYCGSRIVVNFDNSSKLLLVTHKRGNKSKEKVREVFKQAALLYMSPVAKILNNYSSSSNGL